ncbi:MULTISPECIES: HlyD family efflux transporter periplasmic adaptor subunit [Rhodomicrobium]|uniref:efflux RND transporter periplasmic adaptor subunit n=1 Tax=Rhodomicrobium TaxID=1068 RepID=UPI000B4AAA01|nr:MULTISPECIES: HlyD family efflux transporter periplasmic adaptor subunit [Rhodomicrobium]
MTTFRRYSRAFARAGRVAFAAIALAASLLAPVAAHEGHDHAETPAALPQAASPKLVLQSETYQFVALLKDGDLTIFLDRTADNAPVADATISLGVGDAQLDARPGPGGTYVVEGGPLRTPGQYEVIASITGGAGDDLLIGTLTIPDSRIEGSAENGGGDGFQRAGLLAWSYGLGLFLGGLLLGLLLRGGRGQATGIAVVLILGASLAPPPTSAHEGHDHSAGSAAPAALAGDVPRRLEDGSLFVPKPTQRLLEVRTAIVTSASVQPGVRFIGRVIADPNRSGLVQSINGGRIFAPEGGLSKLGAAVAKGQILAEVEPPLARGDYSDLAERSGEIDQQIALAEAKLKRYEQLIATNAVAQAQLDDARTELDGLQRRRASLTSTQREREVLRAPVAGIIASTRMVAGQVVEARDVLFQIIDPAGFWVEALAFDPRNAEAITGGHAVLEDGKILKLALEGKGRALQQHAIQLQFSVEGPANLSLGMPLTVLAQRDRTITGKVVPRDAVVRGANGETLVFEHLEPERFIPRLVRTEPVDGERVLILAGIEAGARIVVRSAEILNQVR